MLFDRRDHFRPYEYPEVLGFVDSIAENYWTHKEYNFIDDIQDFKVNMSESERIAISRAFVMISQVEVAVKSYWGHLYDRIPKAEIGMVGATFSESEVRHSRSYSHLLDIMGLSGEFEKIYEVPAVIDRHKYLTKHLEFSKAELDETFFKSLLLFTLFIENVSLFGQFIIIMSFNHEKNLLKDASSVVDATAAEECYIEGTEALTPDGWKLISDMEIDDPIYQYTEDKKIQETKVRNTISKQFSGDLIKLYKKKHSCTVTPNHIIVSYKKDGKLIKDTANDFLPSNCRWIPCSGELETKNSNSLSWDDRLRIAIQADAFKTYWIDLKGNKLDRGKNGGVNYTFGLSKERKKRRLENILSNLKISYTVCDGSKNKSNEKLYKFHYEFDKNYKNFDWIDISSKSKQWCEEFIEELQHWDGFAVSKHSFGYSNINKKDIDKAQLIGILAGYRTTISKGKESLRKSTYKDCYKLYFNSGDLAKRAHSIKKEYINYSGKVSCVSVDSGIIITRYNDETFIAGNCLHAQFGIWLINTIKDEYTDWWTEDIKEFVRDNARKAMRAEEKVLDWIFEEGELTFLPKEHIKEFLKDRLNQSLEQIGIDPIFETDKKILQELNWYNITNIATTDADFFYKVPGTYSRHNKPFSPKDLF